ncbi:MAG: glutamyl-tRNA reductase, partial [Desulfomicrobium sp.]|nr:glutamyl-tRNA reductase [Desulfomicrobium sp.]
MNHKTAGVDIRERYALSDCDPTATGLVSEAGDVCEAMILSTCNRVEFLVVGSEVADMRAKILRFWADQCGQPLAD